MSSPEETSTGPVIRDLRRIDPETGQVRDHGQTGTAASAGSAPGRGSSKPRPGRHAVSQPGGTAASGEPGTGTPGSPDSQGTGEAAGAEPAPAPGPAPGPAGGGRAEPGGPGGAEQMLTDQLGERTADLQRVTAEYANYRKRVERDRIAVREQALANVLQSVLPVLDDIGRAREHGELVGGFKSVADSLESAMTKLGLDSFGEEGEPFDPNVHEALMHSYSPDVTEPSCVRILQPGYRVGDRILRPARVAVAEPGEPAEPAEPAAGSAGEQEPAAEEGTPAGEASAGRGGPARDAAAEPASAASRTAGDSAAGDSADKERAAGGSTRKDGVPRDSAADSGSAGTPAGESGPGGADAPGASG